MIHGPDTIHSERGRVGQRIGTRTPSLLSPGGRSSVRGGNNYTIDGDVKKNHFIKPGESVNKPKLLFNYGEISFETVLEPFVVR